MSSGWNCSFADDFVVWLVFLQGELEDNALGLKIYPDQALGVLCPLSGGSQGDRMAFSDILRLDLNFRREFLVISQVSDTLFPFCWRNGNFWSEKICSAPSGTEKKIKLLMTSQEWILSLEALAS